MKVIVDSLAVEYVASGEGKTVLFLHGWKSSLKTFVQLASRLQGVRIVALDLPGFGHSEKPRRAWTVEEYARFVQKFCDKLGIAPSVLVGHSLGGRIILKAMAEKMLAPEKVVLIASAGVAERSARKNIFWEIVAKTGGVLTALFPESLRDLCRSALYTFLKSDYYAAGDMRETFVNVISEDLSSAAKQVYVPALLVWGAKDEVTPLSEAARLHELIARSELVTVPDAGHFVHETHPALVADAIQRYL